MDNPEPRSQYLNVVLRQIARTAFRIPRFQRHFVWDERDVLELLGSIQKGYPIGSVLTWKVEASDNYFAGYRTETFPNADPAVSNFEVVLDGAQRLSTLYGCLRHSQASPVYQVVYDLRKAEFAHADFSKDIEPWRIKMDALFDSRAFLASQASIEELEDSAELLPSALDLYSTFQDYQIPIIGLSNAVLEDVVEVFRRINSSGTPLSSVDFVRALTWQSEFDLEETFDRFVARYQGTPLEGITEDYVIRCLAITANVPVGSREVVQLKELSSRKGGLAGEVDRMEAVLDLVADYLRRLGAARFRDVPYEIQRLFIFAMLLHHPATDLSRIDDWFWRTTFSEEHQGKPESYTNRLLALVRDGDIDSAFEVRKPVDPDVFALRARRSGSAVTVGFDLLLRRRQAHSLISGKAIDFGGWVHGALFSQEELRADGDKSSTVVTRLANLVVLDTVEALQWREMRQASSLDALRAELAAKDLGIEEAWNTQGLGDGVDVSLVPMAVLRGRSRELLESVIPRT
ncbi:hypothetical protein GCM10009867_20990 [Pedococcus aerophilus]|uniref:GmrSD restriction endonucleases N-terminal domain-containing protein n=1 Tax=Pedococcus aerophilus TaxID=436356 RepID=A0ABP6H3L7_9MICO